MGSFERNSDKSCTRRTCPSFFGLFDRIVVDAPCSGEGMFRKDPNAIKEWTEESPLYCQKRQQEILSSAIKMLKIKDN